MIGPLTYLDAALIAVAFISGLLAMYRGLTRELLSILSWIVAAGATLYFVLNYKKVAEDMAQQMGTQVAVAQIAIGAVIFLIVLIIVHLHHGAHLGLRSLDSRVGMIDRILGLHLRRRARLPADRDPVHVLRVVHSRPEGALPVGPRRRYRCPISSRRAIRSAVVLETLPAERPVSAARTAGLRLSSHRHSRCALSRCRA